MKKYGLLIMVLFLLSAKSPVAQTIEMSIDTAGFLGRYISDSGYTSITHLRLSGKIDARDIRFIRDSMDKIEWLDLRDSYIFSYMGKEGTLAYSTDYAAEEIPAFAFEKKRSLRFIQLPTSVTSVSHHAFFGCKNLTEIHFSLQTESIGNSAFAWCSRLQVLDLPIGLKEIGDYAFENGILIRQVLFPATLRRIGDYAFSGCLAVEKLSFPSGLEYVGTQAFSYCTSLSEIHFPANSIHIGDSAFAYATRLSVIRNLCLIPQNYPVSVFYGINKKQCKVFVPSASLPEYKRKKVWEDMQLISGKGFSAGIISSHPDYGEVTTLENDFYSKYSSLTCKAKPHKGYYFLHWKTKSGELISEKDSIQIVLSQDTLLVAYFLPDTLTLKVKSGKLRELVGENRKLSGILVLQGRMDARDFQFLRDSMSALRGLDLRHVRIGAYKGTEGTYYGAEKVYKANQIPAQAFYSRYPTGNFLEYIQLPPEINEIGDEAFKNCVWLTKMNFPPEILTIRSGAFSGCKGLYELLLPEKLKQIGHYAFEKCTGLTRVSFPAGLTGIGEGSFMECSHIQELVLPPEITKVQEFTFQGCSGIVVLVLPKKLISIEEYAFSFCENLKELKLPPKLKYIGRGAFMYCPNIPTLNIPSGITIIEESAFEQCRSLHEIRFSPQLRTIEKKAFKGCVQLRELTIPVTLSQIKAAAFENCHSIEELHIPSTLYFIGDRAFKGCSSLKVVNLPSSLTYLGKSAFRNCSSLTQLLIPSGLFTVEEAAFQGCSGLEELIFPPHLLEIGSYAFAQCYNIRNVTLPYFIQNLGKGAFLECVNIDTLLLPAQINHIGDQAFYGCKNIQVIQSLSTIPLHISSSVFQHVEKNTCLLMTPSGTANMYKQAPVWKQFPNIREGGYTIDIRLNNTDRGYVNKFEKGFYNKGDMVSLHAMARKGYRFMNWANTHWETLSLHDSLEVKIQENTLIRAYFKEQAQPIPATYQVNPGMLGKSISKKRLEINSLTLLGEIDARDVRFMRDSMPELEILDISKVSVVAYQGLEGTLNDREIRYPKNKMPYGSFCDEYEGIVKLSSVKLPENLTGICDYAFSGCDEITEMMIPNQVTYMGEGAFRNCSRLYSLTLPMHLTYIMDEAFEGCGDIAEITFPPLLSSIGYRAFHKCAHLSKISFASGPALDEEAFASCLGLRQIRIENSIPFKIDESTFKRVPLSVCTLRVPSLFIPEYKQQEYWSRFLIFPDTVSVNAFPSPAQYGRIQIAENKGNKKGERKTLTAQPYPGCRFSHWETPSGTFISYQEYIKQTPHYDTTPLVAYFLADTLVLKTHAGEVKKMLDHRKNEVRVLVLKGKIDARDLRFLNDEMPYLEVLDLREVHVVSYKGKEGPQYEKNTYYPAKEIPAYAFSEKACLKSMILPENIVSVGAYAFFNCVHLLELNLPPRLKNIGSYAFYRCFSLKKIENKATNPIPLEDSVFEDVDIRNCKLVVPVLSSDAYRNAEGWNEFDLTEAE